MFWTPAVVEGAHRKDKDAQSAKASKHCIPRPKSLRCSKGGSIAHSASAIAMTHVTTASAEYDATLNCPNRSTDAPTTNAEVMIARVTDMLRANDSGMPANTRAALAVTGTTA